MMNIWKKLVVVVGFVALLNIDTSCAKEQPMFAEPIPNVTVALGRDASLPCVVENLGSSYKVAWVHLDRQMIVSIHRQIVTRIPRFSVSHDHHRTWWLNIRGAQAEDAGRYMCQVNGEPMISQIGTLTVVVPPTIIDAESSPSQLSLREGTRVSLVCRGQGVPPPRVTWKREDGRSLSENNLGNQDIQIRGEELIIQKVSRTDSGAYLCIASNGVPPTVSKRITLDVEFSPMVWVPNQLLGVPLGSSVVLECHTEAHPRPITYWVRSEPNSPNDMMLLPSVQTKPEVFYEGYQTHMRLHVRQVENHHYGNYRCIAKNSLGEAEGSIRLYEMAVTQVTTKHPEIRTPTTRVKPWTTSSTLNFHLQSPFHGKEILIRNNSESQHGNRRESSFLKDSKTVVATKPAQNSGVKKDITGLLLVVMLLFR